MTEHEEAGSKTLLLGQWLWIFATAWLAIGIVVFIGCGCEDDGDTIYQEGDINIPTNSTTPVIIASGNSGDTDIKITQVDAAAGEGEVLVPPSIIVADNEGNTSISVTQTSQPAPEPETP